ncbi:ribonuclease H-like domain-containing protein [Paenibacillus xerothermodurans]|uniref:YprB ribonuclease H-like domain-containing protein n=1 Tax=Paenibacillus xerothermodurans TaxID=1977292 RepID=A0A2W1ND16_PAEXE|nr:ribonuclease H-like domain-containing protein [Paenibacillus xerothermodurans]PZE21824.1 hypothetical protein CBW46_005315 [Paenibacillus xerothermodurans]
MSGLRERLLRHKKPIGERAAGAPEAAEAAAAGAAREAEDQEWAAIGAHMEQGEWGAFVMRRREYDTAACHGRYALNELIGQSDQLHVLLARPGTDSDPTEGQLPHDKLLFVDTETTGLGIGAGNVPFMIGIGFYTHERFVVEQMFIRDPGEEVAMLHYLHSKLQSHPYLVSYNGKTFDWPIIKNRYIVNRMPVQPDIAGHLDFLYPSRSLWKHTLPSCRLGKVEEERLAVIRQDDVAGSLAPALYFQYLAERKALIVQGVFVHNELDILSLAGLSIHFAGALNGKSNLEQMDLEELYRLTLWFDKLNQPSLAAPAVQMLTERVCREETEHASEYLLPLAQLYKQRHCFTDACKLWTLYIQRRGARSTAALEPYIELSKHYEHKLKKLEQALDYAEQALLKARQRQVLTRSYGTAGSGLAGRSAAARKNTKDYEQLVSLEQRIQRLQLKLYRSSAKSKPTRGTQRPPRKQTSSAAQASAGYVMDSLI